MRPRQCRPSVRPLGEAVVSVCVFLHSSALLSMSFADLTAYDRLPSPVQNETPTRGGAGFALSDAEMASLDALDKGQITGWDPITQDPV